MTKEDKEKKKFKCKQCDEEFDRTVDLARHVRLKHKLKPTATPMPTGAPTPAATPVPDVHGVEEGKGRKIVPAAKEGKEEEGGKTEAEVVKPKETAGTIVISTPPPEKVDMTSRGVSIGPKTLNISPRPAEEVKETESKYEPLLLSYPEVTGVGVGRTADGRPAIEVLVCKKCPEHEDIPKFLDGVPVIIHEVGRAKDVESPTGETGSETERKETLIDKVAHAKKLGIFFEGPIRKSFRKWLMRRREGKAGRREG